MLCCCLGVTGLWRLGPPPKLSVPMLRVGDGFPTRNTRRPHHVGGGNGPDRLVSSLRGRRMRLSWEGEMSSLPVPRSAHDVTQARTATFTCNMEQADEAAA